MKILKNNPLNKILQKNGMVGHHYGMGYHLRVWMGRFMDVIFNLNQFEIYPNNFPICSSFSILYAYPNWWCILYKKNVMSPL